MIQRKGFVYKFIDEKNNVLYVGKTVNMDARMNEILNFIQENYTSVTLEDLSEHFHLSKPYLSKYIKNMIYF